MGRRRRKALRVVRRSLPKVFACPRCGMLTVRITSHQDDTSQDTIFMVACGNTGCRLRRELRHPTRRAEIDVYNTFVDDFARAVASSLQPGRIESLLMSKAKRTGSI